MTERGDSREPEGAAPPRVSIGLPVYNGERFLQIALDSVLAQSFRDFELIISDNGSTDATERICRAYAEQDPRVRYFRHERNAGVAWNYNRVFHLARGDYFKWIAYDDVCAPDFLARCVAALDDDAAVLAVPRVTMIDEDGATLFRNDVRVRVDSSRPHERFYDLIKLTHYCFPIHGLFRRKALEATPLIGSYPSADIPLLCRLALMGTFHLIPEDLFFNRRHARQSVRLNRFERAAWFEPARAGDITFPEWRLLYELARCVWQAPLPLSERARCAWALLQWPSWNRHWRSLGKDVAVAGIQAARVVVSAASGWRRRLDRPGSVS